mgnify:CR=1 FL=1
MKFSCDKYVLQQAAASAARAAAAKSPIPTLEGLLIEAGASVRITGAVHTHLPGPPSAITPSHLRRSWPRLPGYCSTSACRARYALNGCWRCSWPMPCLSASWLV